MIPRREIDRSATALIRAHKSPGEIYQSLITLGAAPCVARDWANEPARRRELQQMAQDREARRHRISRPRAKYRRVIATHTSGGRTVMQHATKGIRDMRA